MKFLYTRKLALLLLALAVGVTACRPEEEEEEPAGASNRTSGFVVVGTTSSNTSLVKYVTDLPDGEVDLSDGTDFQSFFPTASYNGALYMARPDGSAGFSKMVVNQNGEIKEDGVIATVDASSFRIGVRDAGLGVFQDRATPDVITIFNPSDLSITGSIDMTDAPTPGDIDQRYQRFVFRGDDVFAPVRGNDGTLFTSFILHQGNVATQQYVGSTSRDEMVPIATTNNFGQGLVDTDGDLYVQDAGNYDGTGVPARIHRIAAGSDSFDPNYVFAPAQVLNPTNTFLPTFTTFKLTTSGKAIAKVNSDTPQEAIDIVVAAGGVENLTTDQINQIFGILFTAETAQWCEIDLDAQTVTPIAGVPAQGVFSGGMTFSHDGFWYLPVATTSQSAYYKYDPATGAAELAFSVAGADIVGVYNLAENN